MGSGLSDRKVEILPSNNMGVALSRTLYVVPSSGERIFGGTQDHEMAFSVSRSKFKDMAEGLEYVGKHGGFRFPVPVFGTMAEPKFPEKYKSIMTKCK